MERPNSKEETPRQAIVDLYQQRENKYRIVSIPDEDDIRRDQFARSSEDVNIQAQMQTMSVHRSMMDSDTAHINNEVELSALEEGLTVDL